MFHLSWFTNIRPHGWGAGGPTDWSGNDIHPDSWMDGSFLMDMAKRLDAAGFDFMMLEDHVANEPRAGIEPRIDPLPLIPLLASVTKNLGIIGTASTSSYTPYMLARLMLSADHLAHGRAGWNIVTTSEDYAARAMGTGDKQPPHDERYERAEEFVDLVKQLWDGWDADAIDSSPGAAQYVDPAKLHPVDFNGTYYRSDNGLLNVARSRQGRPAISQAGSSSRGRKFAARNADVILTTTDGADDIGEMKAFRDDVRAQMAALGRDPDDCKILYLVTPILGRTDDEAEAAYIERFTPTDTVVRARLRTLGNHINRDLTQFDFDAPMPTIDPETVHGHRGSFENYIARSENGTLTIRETVAKFNPSSLKLHGTPKTVADRMEEVMEGVGGDGFLILSAPLTRRYIADVIDGLVPELQRRGLVRSRYTADTLRGNLLEF